MRGKVDISNGGVVIEWGDGRIECSIDEFWELIELLWSTSAFYSIDASADHGEWAMFAEANKN